MVIDEKRINFIPLLPPGEGQVHLFRISKLTQDGKSPGRGVLTHPQDLPDWKIN